MSTLARPSPTHAPGHEAAPPGTVVRWSIARAAAAAAMPELVGPAGPPVILEWQVARANGAARSFPASARLLDPLRDAPIVLLCLTGHASIAWTRGNQGAEHIDIDGLLSATFRPDRRGGRRLLYARTSLFPQWGIPGGRYEAIGAADARAD